MRRTRRKVRRVMRPCDHLKVWRDGSGRFKDEDEPNPIVTLNGVEYNLLIPDALHRTGADKVRPVWYDGVPRFDSYGVGAAFSAWTETVDAFHPGFAALMEEDRFREAAKYGTEPPCTLSELRRARYEWSRQWEFGNAVSSKLRDFATEYRNRKRVIAYEAMMAAGLPIHHVKLSKSSHSCYLYLDFWERFFVRLSDHNGVKPRGTCFLDLRYVNRSETIRRCIGGYSRNPRVLALTRR